MAKQPNILVLMSDDHAQWASGCYGNRTLHTPAMDHLAKTGLRMANAFTPTPVCSPARASFWTGLMPSQHGVHDFLKTIDPEVGSRDWLGDTPTLAQLLHSAGYHTGLCGKWHAGLDNDRHAGFDQWFCTGRDIPVHFGPHTYSNNGQPEVHGGYMTQVITDQAVRLLRQRDQDRPFFLYVGYTGTHSPWTGHPERLVDPYRGGAAVTDLPDDAPYPFGRMALESTLPTRNNPDEALAQYYASVSAIDEGIGRLIDELEGQGVRNETLVVYTADHGLCCGHHQIWGKGNSTRPYNMVEESIRIPLILSHPGQIPAGQVSTEFADLCDLFATLLGHAGVDLPSRAGIHYPGRDFRSDTAPKQAQMGEYGNLRMIRTDRHKLVRRYPDGPCELFDLEADPRETINRFDEPSHLALVTELTRELDAYFSRYADHAHDGLRVRELPAHNPVEAWRGQP